MKNILSLARLAVAFVALGASLAFALPFSADYRVSTLGGSSQNPRIAGEAGTNNLHLVWIEGINATTSDVYYARSTNNGTSWEAPKRITPSSVNARFPSIAAANGNVVIVWMTDFNSGGIFYSRSTNSGVSFSAPGTIFDAAGYSRNPEIVADAAGHFHLAWYDSLNNAGAEVGDIFYTLSCDGFASWSSVKDLTAFDGDVDSESPMFAVDSAGTVWLTFRSTRNGSPQGGWPPYQQYLTRLTSKTCGVGSNFLWPPAPISQGLPDTFANVYGATIAPAPSGGRMHIAWWDNAVGNNITYRTGTAGKGFTIPLTNLSQLGANNPQIAAGNSDIAGPGIAHDNFAGGKVHVFWWEESTTTEGFRVGKLRYRESTNLGVDPPTFGAPTDLVATATAMTPKALYHNGRVHVVWADYRNAPVTSAEIYHKFANEDGSISNSPAVSLSETAYLFPNTAVGATSAPHGFTLTNTGNANLVISSVGASSEFGQSSNCVTTLAPSAACTINATFSPAAAGLRSGSITISSNASGSPHTIALTGNGEDASADTDNDGVPNGVEPAEGLNPAVKDNDIFNNPRLFAMQQYRDFLSREGDSGGITFWTNQIQSGGQTRSQCVESFFNSLEFQGTVAPVVRLYFAYFLRVPDYGGLQFWINYSKTNSLDSVSNHFAASPEFQNTYGSLNNTQYVTLVYNNVLGRNPDTDGLNFWVNQLNTAQRTRGQVMLAFSESDEYKAVSFNKVYVTMMYVGMLRRSPDDGGFNFWVSYMNSGNSGLALIGGFVTSSEYRGRFLP